MCSAALFTRLAKARVSDSAKFVYHACGYGPEQGGVSPTLLSGDENAILDFATRELPS